MADTIDFEAIGKTVQQQHPQYAKYDPNVLGQLYTKKFQPADYAKYIANQSAAIDVGQAITTEQGKRAVDYSPEAVSQEVTKQKALDAAKAESDQAKKQKDAETIKKEIVDKAREMANVIEAGRTGKLKGKQYEIAYKFAASNYAAARGFQEGGKALTGPELTQLAGSMPRIQQQNFIEKALGTPPSGNVQDSPDELYQKALFALRSSGDSKDRSRAEKAIKQFADSTPIMPGAPGWFQASGAAAPKKPVTAADFKNDLVGMLKGIASPQGIQSLAQTANPINALLHPENTINMAKGMVDSYKTTLSNNPQAAEYRARHPVETLLNLTAPAALFSGAGAGETPLLTARTGQVARGVDEASNVARTGEVAQTAGVGDKLVGEVRKIDVGPMVGGPQKEAQINQTLNELGFKGGPKEQYAKIAPTMNDLGVKITKELQAKPSTISIDEVSSDIVKNWRNEFPDSSISETTAKGVASKYLSNIFGKELNSKISYEDLFREKQRLNRSFQRIKKKVDNGVDLTPEDQIAFISRQAIDDIITEKYPQVKKMTLQQSDLFDATDSLYNQTKNQMRARIPLSGNYIPLPAERIRAAGDLMGRLLSGR